MRTIYASKRLRLRIPSTRSEWVCLLMVLAAGYNLIAGDTRAALDLLQLALLFEIVGRLPPEIG